MSPTSINSPSQTSSLLNSGGLYSNCKPADQDVIDISEPARLARDSHSTKRLRSNTKRMPPHPYIPKGEIIEISSDEEDTPQQSRISNLQRQLRKIKEENTAYKKSIETIRQERDSLQEENRRLKFANKGKIVLDKSEIEDHLTCVICLRRMWIPFILPGCGHSFCQSCLQDWFSTIMTRYMSDHPEYDPNALNVYLNQLAPLAADPRLFARMLAHVTQHKPSYTCPVCQVPVASKPIEDFALKSLITLISEALGETCPTDVTNPSLLDGFFPKETV